MIKVKVPELMKKEGWNVSELMRKADVAYTTAQRAGGTPYPLKF